MKTTFFWLLGILLVAFLGFGCNKIKPPVDKPDACLCKKTFKVPKRSDDKKESYNRGRTKEITTWLQLQANRFVVQAQH